MSPKIPQFPNRFQADSKQNNIMNGNNTKPVEYVDVDRWLKALRDSRLHYEAEAKKLDERLDSMIIEKERIEHELERISSEEELIAQTTRAYEERLEKPSKRPSLLGDNLREIMIIHFTESDGLIIGRNVSRALVDIGYFPDRKSADGAVYTVLGRPPFQKLDRGIYLIPRNSPEWNRLRRSNGKTLDIRALAQLGLKEQHKTGLVSKVKSMLAEYPNMNIKQVTKELQRQRWDFGGKNPISAVSAAFMRRKKDQKRALKKTLPLSLRGTS